MEWNRGEPEHNSLSIFLNFVSALITSNQFSFEHKMITEKLAAAAIIICLFVFELSAFFKVQPSFCDYHFQMCLESSVRGMRLVGSQFFCSFLTFVTTQFRVVLVVLMISCESSFFSRVCHPVCDLNNL